LTGGEEAAGEIKEESVFSTRETELPAHAPRRLRPFAAIGLAATLVLTALPTTATAADADLTPGPTVVADPNSPTGYTGHFVYYNPDATSVRFVADILLRNWADTGDTRVYQPDEYEPGLMRGGGAYDVQMTEVGDGYWVTDVPLAAGVNQYWFYVDGNTSHWVADPVNMPYFAPDGLTGNARRAFNKVYVPYDAAKQDFAPLEARQIELERPDAPKGDFEYVPFGEVNGAERTIGVYLPPDYDPNRAEPYKTIYMQHGSGQDQSDWMTIGDVPVIMDNLIQDGDTEPAVVISTNSTYLGSAAQGYPNLRNLVMPFVEANYNVSTDAADRAFAGLSMGAGITQSIINYDPTQFAYYGPWSGGASVRATTENLDAPYILYGAGLWDFGLPNVNTVNALDQVAFVENVTVAGAHDFNTWNQMFTIFARDYLWQPDAFVQDEIGQLKDLVADTSLNGGNTNALNVKLDNSLAKLADGDYAGAHKALDTFLNQVGVFQKTGKLTAEQADGIRAFAAQVSANYQHWL